jgi:hypothetical protein
LDLLFYEKIENMLSYAGVNQSGPSFLNMGLKMTKEKALTGNLTYDTKPFTKVPVL